MLLGSVHNAAAHRGVNDMVTELKSCVAWFPPERLKPDCQLWFDRCKHCMAVHRRAAGDPPNISVMERRPFFRMVIDLVEIQPSGTDGERYVLTCICVATRYPFFRTMTTRESEVIAENLLDVMLDAGVVFALIQSDNEFIAAAVEELTLLLGARQLFSTVLRPQSNGVIERPHRDLRAGLAIMVESLARATPRKWPRFIRWLEHKLRHKTISLPDGEHATPYECIHGFFGSSALQTSLISLQKIPDDLVVHPWLEEIVTESQRLTDALATKHQDAAAARSQKQKETKNFVRFQPGQMVLLQKPFYEKGQGLILPQCDGPFLIDRLHNDHTAILSDPLSGASYLGGQRVSTMRLVLFQYPLDALGDHFEELAETPTLPLTAGDHVALELKSQKRVQVGKIVRLFEVGGQAELDFFEVPAGERYGPWLRRPWFPLGKLVVVPRAEILCTVDLADRALTAGSLEKLEALGIRVSGQFHDEKLLPGRT